MVTSTIFNGPRGAETYVMSVFNEVCDFVPSVAPHVHCAIRIPRHQVPALIVGQTYHVFCPEIVL